MIEENESVYLETPVVSYYTSRPNPDIIVGAPRDYKKM